MKKSILLIASILFISCTKKGDIEQEPTDFIIINNKTYKLIKVVPQDGFSSIWIMYPKDSLDSMPKSINYEESDGKHSKIETIIKVD
jgi:hypothetical protein